MLYGCEPKDQEERPGRSDLGQREGQARQGAPSRRGQGPGPRREGQSRPSRTRRPTRRARAGSSTRSRRCTCPTWPWCARSVTARCGSDSRFWRTGPRSGRAGVAARLSTSKATPSGGCGENGEAQGAIPGGGGPQDDEDLRVPQRHAGAEDREGRGQRRSGGGQGQREADGRARERPGGDHRTEARGDPGEEVHCQLPPARGHAGGLQGHPARGADVRVPGPDDQRRPPPRARLQRASPGRVSTAGATTPSASRSTSSSPRSTWRRSRRSRG